MKKPWALLIGAVLLFSTTAVAETFPVPAPWEGEVVFDRAGRFNGCAISRVYDDSSILSLTRGVDGSLLLVLFNRFRIPPENWRGYVSAAVDDGTIFYPPAETVRGSIVVDLTDALGLQVLLENGAWLHLFELSETPFSLQGIGDGMAALDGCLDRRAPVKSAQALPAVGVAVELDTYANMAAAQEDWENLLKKQAAHLAGRTPVYAPRTRDKDGKIFIVLRVEGFTDPTAAAAFCAAMKQQKRDCRVK